MKEKTIEKGTKKMNKYENRTTKAVVAVIDFNSGTLEEKTVTIPYTRTMDKAQKAVAKMLGITPNLVAVRELIQNEFKTNEVKPSEIVNISYQHNLAQAPESVEDNQMVVAYTVYEYYGTVFGYSKNENRTPIAATCVEESFDSLTKKEARNLLARGSEANYGMEIFAIDYKQKHARKMYAIVDKEAYIALRYAE